MSAVPSLNINHLDSAKRVFHIEAEAVEGLAAKLDHNFSAAVERIRKSTGRVIVCGMGKSGIIGKKIAATLASTGTPSFVMHPGEAYHGDLGMVTPEDVFIAISFLCFIFSVPYVYFGWDILLIHLATFIFNIGVVIHMVIYMALWKPKPMDLNKGGMFNYEGIGVTQFLMVIPLMVAPYIVFLPFALLINDYAGIIALAVVGAVGIFFFNQLSAFSIRRVLRTRYEISSSFRQEL